MKKCRLPLLALVMISFLFCPRPQGPSSRLRQRRWSFP